MSSFQDRFIGEILQALHDKPTHHLDFVPYMESKGKGGEADKYRALLRKAGLIEVPEDAKHHIVLTDEGIIAADLGYAEYLRQKEADKVERVASKQTTLQNAGIIISIILALFQIGDIICDSNRSKAIDKLEQAVDSLEARQQASTRLIMEATTQAESQKNNRLLSDTLAPDSLILNTSSSSDSLKLK